MMSAERNKPLVVFKSVGPKMVPFFKTLAIYFVLFGDSSKLESVFYCVIKCLPILSLIIFVLLHGMSFSEYYSYSRNVLLGLIFCCLGDAFMVWKSAGFFLHSMCMFGIGQVFYTMAFGLRPFKPYLGVIFGAVAAFLYSFLYPGLKGIKVFFVAIYIALIGLMVWRAVARVRLFGDLWTWTKLCGCAGAIFFGISDSVIGLNTFCTPVPYAHQIIMTSYYAAQFCITLSVVDSQVDALLSKGKNKPVAQADGPVSSSCSK